MRRKTAPIAMTAALALALAACGGDGGSGDADATETTTGAGAGVDELTPITVGVLPIVDTAAIFLGVDEGIFEEHGLDVDLEIAAGGAAVVPGLVSGDYQFGFSNAVSVLLATDQGLPLQIVASGLYTTGDTAADISAVVVPEGSDITSPVDLEGRTVALNTLNNVGQILVSHVVEEAGGDASTINFVEMGFPDMPAALAGGQIDSAWILEPFLTISQNQGAVPISRVIAETDENLMLAVYFTTAAYAASDPDVVEAFTAAMEESLEFADSNPDAARAILSTYTQIDAEVQEAMVMPRFNPEISTDSLELLTELSQRYGLISEDFDPASVLP